MKLPEDKEFLKKRAEAYRQAKDDPSGGDKDFIFKERVQMFSPRDGENIIRILPAPNGELFPWLSVYVHYQIGANNGQFLCLAKPGNQPCPVCEETKRMGNNKVDPKVISPLYAKHRAIAWLIDRLDPQKGPQIWTMPYKKIASQIVKISFRRNSNEPMFLDNPETGYDIIFYKEGKGIATNYDGVKRDDESSLLHEDDSVAGEWLKQVSDKPIKDLIQYKSYEHIKSVLFGTLPEDEVEKPITSKSTPKASKKTEEVSAETASKAHSNSNGLTADIINRMSRNELVSLINSRDDLEMNPDEWPDTESLASVVAMELNLLQ